MILVYCFIDSVLPCLHRQCQPVQDISACCDGRKPRRIPLAKTRWQSLHNFIIIDREEERNTVSLLRRPVHHTMHGALVHPISPTHQEVCNVDHDATIYWFRTDPCGNGGVSKYSNGVVSGRDVLAEENIMRHASIGKGVLSQHLQCPSGLSISNPGFESCRRSVKHS